MIVLLWLTAKFCNTFANWSDVVESSPENKECEEEFKKIGYAHMSMYIVYVEWKKKT